MFDNSPALLQRTLTSKEKQTQDEESTHLSSSVVSFATEELERAHAETSKLRKKLAEMERNQKAMQRDIARQQGQLMDQNNVSAKEQVDIVAKQKESTQLSQKRTSTNVSIACHVNR